MNQLTNHNQFLIFCQNIPQTYESQLQMICHEKSPSLLSFYIFFFWWCYITLQRWVSQNPGQDVNKFSCCLLLTFPVLGMWTNCQILDQRQHMWLWGYGRTGPPLPLKTKQPSGSRSFSRISCSFDALWRLVDHSPWTCDL